MTQCPFVNRFYVLLEAGAVSDVVFPPIPLSGAKLGSDSING